MSRERDPSRRRRAAPAGVTPREAPEPSKEGARGATAPSPALLYLFDGYNLLHAGEYRDPRELIDTLAGFVAMAGARGVLVFDGVGQDTKLGALEVRYAADADAALERLAAEHRDRHHVVLVSSDAAVRGTSGHPVQKIGSATFLRDLPAARHEELRRSSLADRLDEKTRAELERLRRGGQD